ncbi:MAG: pyridoxamine 5'-phosphate oxidase family protein [Chitinophagaceae bacterium]|nr:pyridoxamine 5'-phosphate oxidase family protein [Chitinophagaceae bacterium]
MHNHSFNPDSPFLRKKIQELKNALFFSENNSVLKMVTTIVSIVKVDELGQLWFFVPRPTQALHEFDREFPARLEFFRKGKGFFLRINGKAYIVDDPEEVNSLLFEELKEQLAPNIVLIKVKMGKVEYFESMVRTHPTGWWHGLRTQLRSFLFNTRPGYKPYQLDAPQPMLRPVA